jgi:hypothetical protein
MSLMTLMPRLLLSIIVTICSSFVIGAVISFANLTTQGIFDIEDGQTIGAMHNVLLNAGFVVGSDSDILTQLIEIIVGAMVAWFSILFLAGSVLRQMLLIALIILAPVAAFCLINDRWRPRFNQWLRALIVVAFVPVVMAFILKIGMSINPILANPDKPVFGGFGGAVGVILIVAVFWAMARAMRMGFSMIGMGSGSLSGGLLRGGGSASSMGGKALAKAGLAGGPLGAAAGLAAGGALMGLGGAMRAGGAASGAADRGQARLIPGGRASGGALGAAMGGSSTGLLGGRRGPGGGSGGVSTGIGGLDRAASTVNDRINSFIARKSSEADQGYQGRVRQLRAGANQMLGRGDGQQTFDRRLSADEVAELRRTEDAYRAQGLSNEQIEKELGGRVDYDRKSGSYVHRQHASRVIEEFQEKRGAGQIRRAAPAGPMPHPNTAPSPNQQSGGPSSRPVPTNPTSNGGPAPRAPGASTGSPTVDEAEVASQMSKPAPLPDGHKKTIKVADTPAQVTQPKPGAPRPKASSGAPGVPSPPQNPSASDHGVPPRQ